MQMLKRVLQRCLVLFAASVASHGSLAADLTSGNALKYYDANGKPVGRVAPGERPGVIMCQAGQCAIVSITGYDFGRDYALGDFPFSELVWFSSTDCTGEAYASLFDQSPVTIGLLPTRIQLKTDGTVLLYVASSGRKILVDLRSHLWQGNCVEGGTGTTPVLPLSPPIDLSGRFTPPFTIH